MSLIIEACNAVVDCSLPSEPQPTIEARLLEAARAVCDLHQLSLLVLPDAEYYQLSHWQAIGGDSDRGVAMTKVRLSAPPTQPQFQVLAATLTSGSQNTVSMRVVVPNSKHPEVDNTLPITNDDPWAFDILKAFTTYLADPYSGTESATRSWWVRMHMRLQAMNANTINLVP